jgi:uncharacterized protein
MGRQRLRRAEPIRACSKWPRRGNVVTVGDLLDAGDAEADAVLHVHVATRAGRDEIRGRHGDTLRVRVQAPPVDGRANDAVRSLLGSAFHISDSRVELVSGDRSRLKRFRLHGVGRAAAEARLRELLDPPGPARRR